VEPPRKQKDPEGGRERERVKSGTERGNDGEEGREGQRVEAREGGMKDMDKPSF